MNMPIAFHSKRIALADARQLLGFDPRLHAVPLNWQIIYENRAYKMISKLSFPRIFVLALLASIATVFLLAGCAISSVPALVPAPAPAPAPVDRRLSTLDINHVLVGKIWAVKQQRWISESDLNAELASKRFILLGETHDNPDHHRLQLAILNAMTQQRASTRVVAMEQFDIDNQAAIDAAMMLPNPTADAIADAGKLDRKGWDWDQYRPIVDFAILQKLRLRAANLSRGDGRQIFSLGLKASPVKFADEFFTNTWNTARNNALQEELLEGHCGQLPDSMASGMGNVQRARDAIMAGAMLAAKPSGAVLIAGRGHVRRDRAVPLYLQTAAPNSEIAVVAFIEVVAAQTSPRDYIDSIVNEAEPFDYVWFTPRVARKDPCEGISLSGLKPTADMK